MFSSYCNLFLLIILAGGIVVHSEKDQIMFHLPCSIGLPYHDRNYTSELIASDPIHACSSPQNNIYNKTVLIQESNNCSLAHQLSNIYVLNPYSIIVINSKRHFSNNVPSPLPIDSSAIDNITVPVVSISNEDGCILLSNLQTSNDILVTISSIGEYSVLSLSQYILILSLIFLMMWGGLGFMSILNQLSSIIKRQRRCQFVKTIKITQFRLKKLQHVEEQPTCSICLSEFENGELIKKLHCGHFYHSDCIDPWLLKQKGVCPICRKGIYEVDEWNALEEGQSRDIDCLMERIEQKTPTSFSNLFSLVFCLFVVGYPICIILSL